MKAVLEPTDKTVTINGLPCRVWQGLTTDRIAVHLVVVHAAATNPTDAELIAEQLSHFVPATEPVKRMTDKATIQVEREEPPPGPEFINRLTTPER